MVSCLHCTATLKECFWVSQFILILDKCFVGIKFKVELKLSSLEIHEKFPRKQADKLILQVAQCNHTSHTDYHMTNSVLLCSVIIIMTIAHTGDTLLVNFSSASTQCNSTLKLLNILLAI